MNPSNPHSALKLKHLSIAVLMATNPLVVNAHFDPVEALSRLNGRTGFVFNGESANSGSGNPVSSAGDINGDGINDLVIGATGAVNPTSGEISGACYVVFGDDSGANPRSLGPADLDGTNGFVLNSVGSNDRAGYAVSGAGDVNGDGVDDLIVSASLADSNGNDNAGAGYVVFGVAGDFPASIDLSSLDGSNGFALNGVAENDWTGKAVSALGDINGDGMDDVIISSRMANPNGLTAGASYVVFGRDTLSPFPASMDLASLDGSNGFMLTGVTSFERSGVDVSAAGDINGDGMDDLIVGANIGGLGGAYVVFGIDMNSSFPASMNLSTLDGNNGFVFNGLAANDRAGYGVSDAGDINGDGIDDLIIGAFGADPNGDYSGASYVVFGSTVAFAAAMAPTDLNGSNGFVINGIAADDNSGRSVSGAGDINDDGINDLIIGANRADANGGQSGASYVLFGRESGNPFTSPVNLAALDGENGFMLQGAAPGDESGISVAPAGDFNADGVDDVIVGAWRADPSGESAAGASYIVFGRESLFVDGFEQ